MFVARAARGGTRLHARGMFIEADIMPFEVVGTTKPPGPMWTLTGTWSGTGTIDTGIPLGTSTWAGTGTGTGTGIPAPLVEVASAGSNCEPEPS